MKDDFLEYGRIWASQTLKRASGITGPFMRIHLIQDATLLIQYALCFEVYNDFLFPQQSHRDWWERLNTLHGLICSVREP